MGEEAQIAEVAVDDLIGASPHSATAVLESIGPSVVSLHVASTEQLLDGTLQASESQAPDTQVNEMQAPAAPADSAGQRAEEPIQVAAPVEPAAGGVGYLDIV